MPLVNSFRIAVAAIRSANPTDAKLFTTGIDTCQQSTSERIETATSLTTLTELVRRKKAFAVAPTNERPCDVPSVLKRKDDKSAMD